MKMSVRVACGFIVGAAVGSAYAQSRDPAQNYPARPLRILVGFSAGSTTDILARVVGQKLSEKWGQPVIVDNRPSAGGVVASQQVTSANPDGYTLISVSAGHAVSAALYNNLPYDTEKDFSGISLLATVPSILIVAPNAGVKSVKELVARAAAKPGVYNYSSPGIGSANHLGSELLKSLAHIDVTHVPFKGIPEAVTAAATGTVLFNLSPIVNVLPLAKSGRVIALATSTSKRSVAMPDLPTIAEAGVTGYAFDPWFGLLATGKTPRPIVAKLNGEVVRILGMPDVKEKLLGLGAEATPTTPEQFDAHVHAEIAKFKKIVREAHIQVE